MKTVRRILLLSAILLFAYNGSSPSSLYKQVMNHNLVSLEFQDEDWPNEPFYDFIMRCEHYQGNLQEFKKRRAAFQMIERAQSSNQAESSVMNDTLTWKDLNLFAGQKDVQVYLADKIDRTNTCFGKVTLYTMLAQAGADIITLEHRQDIIRLFTENPELSHKVSQALLKLKNGENQLLSFWCNDPIYHACKKRYFSFVSKKLTKACNGNKTLLMTRTLLDHAQRVLATTTAIAASTILPIHGLGKIFKQDLPPVVNQWVQHLQTSSSQVVGVVNTATKNKEWLTAILSIIAGGYSALCLKDTVAWMRDNFILDQSIHRRLSSIASYLEGVRDISMLIKKHPEIRALVPDVQAIEALFDSRNQNEEVNTLFKLLLSPNSCFKGAPGLVSNKGTLFLAFRLMHENKQYFENAIGAIGQLDAYNSLATLYKEHEQGPAHYSFVKFKQGTHPSISLNDFWNPFLDRSKVVLNSLELGTENARRNMVITGPNAGGKSTLLKAVALTVIMAQCFGIAPAQAMEMTPFAKIISYLNITDDIGSGNSLFKAQVLRAQQLLDVVHGLPENQFGFLIIDEMFNGTSPREASAAAFSVAKNIAQYKNSLCLIATHFPLLTTLEDQTQDFANYNVSVEQSEHGIIKYPFTIKSGISDQHIAIDILRAEGFSGSIIEDAVKLLNG